MATLSYWPANSDSMVTGLKTSPVLLTTDGALGYFCSQMRVNKSMTLCAKFVTGITTKRRCVFATLRLNRNCQLGLTRAHEDLGGISSVGSKTNPILTDEDLVAELDFAEAMLSEGRRKDKESACEVEVGKGRRRRNSGQ